MIQYKQLYRFYCLRHYALSLNSSGLYNREIIKEVAQLYQLSYNTLRADMKAFERQGLIAIHGKKFRLLKNDNPLWYVFKHNLEDILNAPDSAGYFAGLVLKNQFKSFLFNQACKEADKIEDKRIRSRYLKIVRKGSYIGANQGIRAGVRTVGKYFGKSFMTGYRYLQRMEKVGLKIHRLVADVGCGQDYYKLRQEDNYGRLYVENGRCYERLLSSYSF